MSCGKRRMTRTLFTEEEDAKLVRIMETTEFHNWSEVASHFENRNARQVRDRWTNYLNSEINNGPWSKDEDRQLAELYNQYGPRWATISKFFVKRRENNVKNRWYANIRTNVIVVENGIARYKCGRKKNSSKKKCGIYGNRKPFSGRSKASKASKSIILTMNPNLIDNNINNNINHDRNILSDFSSQNTSPLPVIQNLLNQNINFSYSENALQNPGVSSCCPNHAVNAEQMKSDLLNNGRQQQECHQNKKLQASEIKQNVHMQAVPKDEKDDEKQEFSIDSFGEWNEDELFFSELRSVLGETEFFSVW
ncbi:hypothetical protein TRFO_26770 [Tritrichomonas foetus]|uniref:Myb-like DNA-binding domain containing protein n=1 Tax=Tritrichomonas foetus TaxID=1144522 RepID=A0A1J4K3E6_9EUKA|nr:hypothetical protein TRFO_26770 [Tritrichomonas foetus]|eukprot:OHT05498.1 hypothetical protein TRFO_26770 [Tritrichomonas foetus]